jgi:3alpha(or 20beta)-hydroxysteroid dehydrogenase
MFDLKGKVAVVTGGGSGIGRATVHRLAAAGARVLIADLTDQTAFATEVDGASVRTDVTREEDVATVMTSAVRVFGGLDIVVSCAGIAEGTDPVVDEEDDLYLKQFRVNTLGVVHSIKHGARNMAGGGSIVTIASITATMALPRSGAYAVSKWGVVGATRNAAVELGGRGIRVNCVCPSVVDTPMIRDDDSPAVRGLLGFQRSVPIPRMLQPEEVAGVVHFLASDESGPITGQVLNVDGGWSVGPSIEHFDWLAAGPSPGP